ncbi:MAG TPA: GNAT family N-acetyltransferase, partial [Terriglobales bacterium]|nr:GNAT family N-acetyltransferase [Terriglobales bacterium]
GADIPAIVSLVNRAFEVELFFLNGDRTNVENVTEMMTKGEYLLAETPDGNLVGAVYFENRGERAYFGMLSVEPRLKGTGLGRLLIETVEAHARKQGCVAMDITVVNLRTELPPYYRRFGYEISGELPPPEPMRVRSKIPCHLVRLSKSLL